MGGRPDVRDPTFGFSPPFSEAGLDEFVHLPRDGSDIEQSLDPLAPGAGKLGAPIGRIQQLAERHRNAIGVARFDRHRVWTADLGQAAPPRGDDRSAARHGFKRRSAERFGARRQHHSDFRALPRRFDLGIGHVGIDPDPAVERPSGSAKRIDTAPGSRSAAAGSDTMKRALHSGREGQNACDRRHRFDMAFVPERTAHAEDRSVLGFVADQALHVESVGDGALSRAQARGNRRGTGPRRTR